MIKSVKLFVFALCLVLASCVKNNIYEYDGKLKVLEYKPAPGQFINDGMTATTMEEAVEWAQDRLDAGAYVSLGAFGGSITVRMPKGVKNHDGYDFGVVGNAFDGSSEAGIVWVSCDANKNGKADDRWYELKGSADDARRNYSVTYTRTEEPGDVAWTDSDGNTGVVKYMDSERHSQNHFPLWITDDEYTLTGTKLEHRTEYDSSKDRWVNKGYAWGYADNMGSDVAVTAGGIYRYNQFDIDNAIDAAGEPVELSEIHFVRIQSAILHHINYLGEVSTEVIGMKIL